MLKWRYVGYFPQTDLAEYVFYFDGSIDEAVEDIENSFPTFRLKRIWLDDTPDPKPQGWLELDDELAFITWLKTHTLDELFEMQPHFQRDCKLVFYYNWKAHIEKHNAALTNPSEV